MTVKNGFFFLKWLSILKGLSDMVLTFLCTCNAWSKIQIENLYFYLSKDLGTHPHLLTWGDSIPAFLFLKILLMYEKSFSYFPNWKEYKTVALGNWVSRDGGKLPSFRRAKGDGSWGCGQVTKILNFGWYGFPIKCWIMNKINAKKERNGRMPIILWAATKRVWPASQGRGFFLSTPLSWHPT